MNLFNPLSKKRSTAPPLHLTRDTAEPVEARPARNNGATVHNATAQTLLKRSTARDRRRAVRYPCQLQTACVVISLTEPVLLAVRIRDLSQTGVGLVLASRLLPGMFVAVKLQGPRHPKPRILRAQVMHVTPAGNDRRTWVLGCSFVGELGQDEIKLLI